MTDLVTRTAQIAERARESAPTTSQLREKYPELAQLLADIREHTADPAWYQLRDDGRIFYQRGPVPDMTKWRCVVASPSFPRPPKKRGEA